MQIGRGSHLQLFLLVCFLNFLITSASPQLLNEMGAAVFLLLVCTQPWSVWPRQLN